MDPKIIVSKQKCIDYIEKNDHKYPNKNAYTLQPLYNMVRYNMVLDITRFKDGSQKCIDYIEKMTINGHFFGYNTVV